MKARRNFSEKLHPFRSDRWLLEPKPRDVTTGSSEAFYETLHQRIGDIDKQNWCSGRLLEDEQRRRPSSDKQVRTKLGKLSSQRPRLLYVTTVPTKFNFDATR